MYTNIDKLPFYLWVEICQYLPLNEMLTIQFVHNTFKNVFLKLVRDYFSKIRQKLNKSITYLNRKMTTFSKVGQQQQQHLLLFKSILLLRYVSTEFQILYSIVWRYSENEVIWSLFCTDLVLVFDEFENIIINANNLNMKYDIFEGESIIKKILDRYYYFLNKFDKKIEYKISQITSLTKFETRVIDILLCCPSLNFQISVSRLVGDDRIYHLFSTFKLLDLKPGLQRIDVNNISLEAGKSKFIKYLRKSVQRKNSKYFFSDIWYMSKLQSVEMLPFDELIYPLLKNNSYEPIYRKFYFTDINSNYYLEERYQKCSTYDQYLSYLSVVINQPMVTPEDLPLSIHTLRGRRRHFLINQDIFDTQEDLNFIKLNSKNTIQSSGINVKLDNSVFHVSIYYCKGLDLFSHYVDLQDIKAIVIHSDEFNTDDK